MAFVSMIDLDDGGYVSSVTPLEKLLELAITWRESKKNINEAELYAIQLWSMYQACYLPVGETKTAISKKHPSLSVEVGRKSPETVFYDNGEDVYEAKIAELVFLR